MHSLLATNYSLIDTILIFTVHTPVGLISHSGRRSNAPYEICYFEVSILCLSIFATNPLLVAQESGVDQAAFSDLKNQASSLASAGRLKEAIPILEELISRIQQTGNKEIPRFASSYLEPVSLRAMRIPEI